jgi:hypothetical protein
MITHIRTKVVAFCAILAMASIAGGCKYVRVTHLNVENGTLSGPSSYTDSPGHIIVVPTSNNPPKVYFRLSARSSDRLFGIKYEVEKCGPQSANPCKLVTWGLKFGDRTQDEAGHTVWPKYVEFSEFEGKPLVLDLSGTGLGEPLKLTVHAVETTGHELLLDSMYLELNLEAIGIGGPTNR